MESARLFMATRERPPVEDMIRRLLDVKGGKQMPLSEAEIRQLCTFSRKIFLSQPSLLNLSAPIKICGLFASFMSSIEIYENPFV